MGDIAERTWSGNNYFQQRAGHRHPYVFEQIHADAAAIFTFLK
jgi:hypothetical protein